MAAASVAVLAVALAAGCGSGSPTATASSNAASTPIAIPAASAPAANDGRPNPVARVPAGGAGLAARTGEITNPGNTQMVFLYYDLAGIPPPIDEWVEQDSRVQQAPGADKAERRTQVKAELQAGLAAVKDVGVLHLSTYANLSQYDPTYGEFTVGALSPASEYGFEALGRKVSVKFDNGLDAQTWGVPKEQSQAIIDKVGNHSVMLDAVLKITQVLPAPEGGTLVAHVVSWNLRDSTNGTTIAKVAVRSQ